MVVLSVTQLTPKLGTADRSLHSDGVEGQRNCLECLYNYNKFIIFVNC